MADQAKQPVEHSVWDGAGNEIKVANTTDAEGRLSQGTGTTSEEALADAGTPDQHLGHGYDTREEVDTSRDEQ